MKVLDATPCCATLVCGVAGCVEAVVAFAVWLDHCYSDLPVDCSRGQTRVDLGSGADTVAFLLLSWLHLLLVAADVVSSAVFAWQRHTSITFTGVVACCGLQCAVCNTQMYSYYTIPMSARGCPGQGCVSAGLVLGPPASRGVTSVIVCSLLAIMMAGAMRFASMHPSSMWKGMRPVFKGSHLIFADLAT